MFYYHSLHVYQNIFYYGISHMYHDTWRRGVLFLLCLNSVIHKGPWKHLLHMVAAAEQHWGESSRLPCHQSKAVQCWNGHQNQSRMKRQQNWIQQPLITSRQSWRLTCYQPYHQYLQFIYWFLCFLHYTLNILVTLFLHYLFCCLHAVYIFILYCTHYLALVF